MDKMVDTEKLDKMARKLDDALKNVTSSELQHFLLEHRLGCDVAKLFDTVSFESHDKECFGVVAIYDVEDFCYGVYVDYGFGTVQDYVDIGKCKIISK